jgi:hypothetical protein
MPNIEQIRQAISRTDAGELSKEQIYDLLEEIIDFKEIFRYLPNDVSEWYEQTSTFIEQYNDALGGDWEG